MITILHGNDIEASYKKLSELIGTYKNHRLVQFDQHSKKDEIHSAIFGQSLLDEEKLVVLKNLLLKDKDIIKILENSPEPPIICWESSELPQSYVAKLSTFAKVENFKLPSNLFYFLDSIYPGSKKALIEITKLKDEENLLWNIQNRFMLLNLAKIKLDLGTVSKISKRNLAPWQWDKLKSQANQFSQTSLNTIFNASLKIDYLIKSGKTNLPQNALIKIMLLKYL